MYIKEKRAMKNT